MSNVIDIKSKKKQEEPTPETKKVDELFADIIERNRKEKEKLEQIRADRNKAVLNQLKNSKGKPR